MTIQTNLLSTDQYRENFSDIHPPFQDEQAAIKEADRCLYCYDAPCIRSCPTAIDVPKFIKQISSGNIKGSSHTILSANIFGAGCARVCPTEKLCESSCVMNDLKEKPISIGRLQRYSTDRAIQKGWKLFSRQPSCGKKVAIIGAGPAGLSCAHSLAREGVEVDIYEKDMEGGGLMRFGVAGYKIDLEFCRKEMDFITSLGGIHLKYGMTFGKDIFLETLRQNYDSIFIGIGLSSSPRLSIKGEELEGVIDASKLIYRIRFSDDPKERSLISIGEKVVVIGMGMTAIDAARQCLRLGSSQVTLLYRRTKYEMPSTEKEMEEALQEGCRILFLASPMEILGENSKVSSIICRKMRLGKDDGSGRRASIPMDETFEIEADMVVKALGSLLPSQDFISDDLMIPNMNNGKILVDSHKQSNIPGVFAGGDCINGGKEVVDSVEDGKIAAKAMLTYISCQP